LEKFEASARRDFLIPRPTTVRDGLAARRRIAEISSLWATSVIVPRSGAELNASLSDPDALHGMWIEARDVDLPFGSMHFMEMLRIGDWDLAVCGWRRTSFARVRPLQECGYEIIWMPEGDDMYLNRGLNFVTLGPRKVRMVPGFQRCRVF